MILRYFISLHSKICLRWGVSEWYMLLSVPSRCGSINMLLTDRRPLDLRHPMEPMTFTSRCHRETECPLILIWIPASLTARNLSLHTEIWDWEVHRPSIVARLRVQCWNVADLVCRLLDFCISFLCSSQKGANPINNCPVWLHMCLRSAWRTLAHDKRSVYPLRCLALDLKAPILKCWFGFWGQSICRGLWGSSNASLKGLLGAKCQFSETSPNSVISLVMPQTDYTTPMCCQGHDEWITNYWNGWQGGRGRKLASFIKVPIIAAFPAQGKQWHSGEPCLLCCFHCTVYRSDEAVSSHSGVICAAMLL